MFSGSYRSKENQGWVKPRGKTIVSKIKGDEAFKNPGRRVTGTKAEGSSSATIKPKARKSHSPRAVAQPNLSASYEPRRTPRPHMPTAPLPPPAYIKRNDNLPPSHRPSHHSSGVPTAIPNTHSASGNYQSSLESPRNKPYSAVGSIRPLSGRSFGGSEWNEDIPRSPPSALPRSRAPSVATNTHLSYVMEAHDGYQYEGSPPAHTPSEFDHQASSATRPRRSHSRPHSQVSAHSRSNNSSTNSTHRSKVHASQVSASRRRRAVSPNESVYSSTTSGTVDPADSISHVGSSRAGTQYNASRRLGGVAHNVGGVNGTGYSHHESQDSRSVWSGSNGAYQGRSLGESEYEL